MDVVSLVEMDRIRPSLPLGVVFPGPLIASIFIVIPMVVFLRSRRQLSPTPSSAAEDEDGNNNDDDDEDDDDDGDGDDDDDDNEEVLPCEGECCTNPDPTAVEVLGIDELLCDGRIVDDDDSLVNGTPGKLPFAVPATPVVIAARSDLDPEGERPGNINILRNCSAR